MIPTNIIPALVDALFGVTSGTVSVTFYETSLLMIEVKTDTQAEGQPYNGRVPHDLLAALTRLLAGGSEATLTIRIKDGELDGWETTDNTRPKPPQEPVRIELTRLDNRSIFFRLDQESGTPTLGRATPALWDHVMAGLTRGGKNDN
jgi:hypothetical protein